MIPTYRFPNILRPGHDEQAQTLLANYFKESDSEGRPAFTGAKFETLGHEWSASATKNTITAEDLLAVSCLSVNVPAKASIGILGNDAQAIKELLEDVPDLDLALWEADDVLLASDSAIDKLWKFLRRYKGIGPTTTSKLMARKRPNLIPIYDSVLADALGLKDSRHHWMVMRTMMLTEYAGEPLHQRLRRMVEKAELDFVTPLRAFDVIVWCAENPHLEGWRQRLGVSV